ncbi:MAG: c-type cytochrome biogenesis protein CcmI, partial [Roseovarius sp.]|nr:c-type cytochrome biogenesis protein CcmI [Roseovarius sp.]
MGFWIIVGTLAIAIGAVLALTLLRGRVGDAPPAAYDLQVYRDQLKEVERDAARGVIDGPPCVLPVEPSPAIVAVGGHIVGARRRRTG